MTFLKVAVAIIDTVTIVGMIAVCKVQVAPQYEAHPIEKIPSGEPNTKPNRFGSMVLNFFRLVIIFDFEIKFV